MTYQALYRQWRPLTFSDMVGQEAIVRTLRNQVDTGRVAHAYLFCGSRGTGKTSAAKIMARAVNCTNPQNGDPCGVCEACERLKNDTNLDILEIDAASNNGVDEIRDLRENVKYPPQYGRYKVYIIDEVHMLSTAAFNALLKTLEEPPAHVVFILATTEPQKLPATILSRCQRFDFGRFSAHQIVQRLELVAQGAGGKVNAQALQLIARAAEGGMRDALNILDMCLGYGSEVTEEMVRSVLGTADKGFLFRFGEALANTDPRGVMGLIDELMRSGREPQVFAKDVSQHLRSLMMAKTCADDVMDLLDITKEDADSLITQGNGFTQERLLRLIEIFLGVETEMRWASSPRIALESAALKACLKTKEVDQEGLLERIGELEAQVNKLKEQVKNGVVMQATSSGNEKSAPAKKADKPLVAQPAKAPPIQPTGLTPESVWEEALKTIRKTEPGLYGQLKIGTFRGCQGQMYRLGVSKENDFICVYLNKTANKQKVMQALTQAAGQQCGFEVTVEMPRESQSQIQQEKSLLDNLYETFGKENVQIQEE